MHYSSWDLEVHAREMRRRWLREAERARQFETARQRGNRPGVPAARFSVARFMTALRSSLSPRRSPVDGAAGPALAEAVPLPLPLEELRRGPDPRSSALSQPYAGMVVLARGTSVPNAVQSCPAGDC
jgi:hypothetical protein